jgi:hypothetical protein
MDPLSVSASILTVVAAVGKTLEFVKSARGCPKEVDAVINEVSDFTVVCRQIDLAIRDGQHRDAHHDGIDDLSSLLSRAKATTTKLDDLIHGKLLRTLPQGGSPQVSRLNWIREKGSVQSTLGELRDVRINLATALSAFTS